MKKLDIQHAVLACLTLWGLTCLVGKHLENVDMQTNYRPIFVAQQQGKNKKSVQPSMKKILFYTPFFHMQDWEFGFGHEPFVNFQCPVSSCFTTNNKSQFGSILEFDAILFHIRDMHLSNDKPIMTQLPDIRGDHQRYVFFLMESPSYDTFPHESFANYFNWTMTYRRDSDFYRPYGWIAPKNWDWHYPKSALNNISWSQYPRQSGLVKNFKHKLKRAAWLVSNCHTMSQREHYVQELAKHFPVDIYGHCPQILKSHGQCPDNSECSDFIQDNYMFYLSFENSMCRDYVTEKFWNFLSGKLIPIVLGGADYKKVAPAKSYINVLDFANPLELAQHLKYISTNVTAYSEYFEWVPHFNVFKNEPANFARAMCQLCEAMHSPDLDQPMVYKDTQDWWVAQGQCSQDFPWIEKTYKYQWTKLTDWSKFLQDSASKALDSLRSSQVII